MKLVSRCPLVSFATLAAYLLVYVLAGAVHHHSEASALASGTTLQYQTTDAGDNDEETCLLCAVLHLAQIAPTALEVEAVTTLDSNLLSATALIRPHPLETTTHSRGPPLM
jgi:hypothetical protein